MVASGYPGQGKPPRAGLYIAGLVLGHAGRWRDSYEDGILIDHPEDGGKPLTAICLNAGCALSEGTAHIIPGMFLFHSAPVASAPSLERPIFCEPQPRSVLACATRYIAPLGSAGRSTRILLGFAQVGLTTARVIER